MNPASNAATSGGVAGAAVVVLSWLLSFAHITVPADVDTALGILLTAGIGYFLHVRSLPKPAPVVVAPAAPEAK